MGDRGDVSADFLGDGSLLFSGRGNLGGHVGDVGDRFADAHQCLVCLKYPDHAFLGLTMTALYGLHGIVGRRLELGDQVMDLGGGLRGALGQLANLIGHDSETPAHVAGARCFDGGIQCQQIGLIGDAFDHVNDCPYFVAVPGQLCNCQTCLADNGGEALDSLSGVSGHIAAATGQQVSLLGGISRTLDVAEAQSACTDQL